MNFNDYQDGEEYKRIFENAMEGIFQSSIDGRYLKVNPAMAHIYGYDSAEDMIKSITDISKQIHVDNVTRKKFTEELITHGRVVGFEARNYRKDGSIIWTRTNARTVRDKQGKIQYFEGFLTDVTSHKMAENALREGEERYRALVERLPGAVFLDRPDNSEKTLYINSKIQDILGYSQEEWISQISWSDLIHPEDRERVRMENEFTDETGDVFQQEYRLRKKTGDYVWIREESSLVKDENGKPLYWQGFFLDISLQKQAEKAILNSVEQFKKIFQANPIASLISTLQDGRILAANHAYGNLSGFETNDLLGRTTLELGFISKNERKALVTRLNSQKTLRNVQGKMITKFGEVHDTLEFYDVILFENQECILGMYYDVTEQAKAQRELQDNEEKFRQLFEAESDALFLIDNESGKILEANAAASALYGYSKADLLKMKNIDLSAEPDETRSVTQNTPVNIRQVISIPLRLHRKQDGTVFPVEITGRFFTWRGRPVHIAAIRDITERKRVEEALYMSEQNFRNIVEHTTNIYYSHTTKHVLTFMSPQAREILGYDPDEMLVNWHDLLTDNPFNHEGIALTQQAIDTGKRQKTYSLELKHKAGHAVWVEVHESPIVHNGKTVAIVGSLTDISERKRAEDILKRQLEELTILQNIAVAASSSISLDELINRTTEAIFETLHPDSCGVELITELGESYKAHPSYKGGASSQVRKTHPISIGVTGKVISTGKPIRLGDVTQEPAFIPSAPGICSELCVPMKIQDRIIGAINIESKLADAYDESDERLLNTIAGTLATAIEQLRLFETSQKRLKELSILNNVGIASTNATSVDELIENITQIIGESLYPDNFGVLMLDDERKVLSPHPSYRGISFGKFPKTFSLDRGICGQVAASGKPLRIANVRGCKNYIEVTSQVRSEVCVPIAQGDRILGVINAESLKINKFAEEDERLLITIASTLATTIEKLRLLEIEKKRRQEAETLLEATSTLTTSLNMEMLLDSILESLFSIVPYDSASISMIENGKITILAGRGFPNGFDVIGKQLEYSDRWLLLSTTHKPIIVADAQLDESFEKWKGSEYIHGWMGVPIVVHGRLKGFINLDSRKPNAFSDSDAILAQTFANSAAVAVENTRLFEAEQQSRQKAEALREATAALTESLDLDALYKTILDSVAKLVPFDSASIEILDHGIINVVAGRGLGNSQDCIGHSYAYDAKNWGDLESRRAPILIPDVQVDNRFIKFKGTEYIRGWMGVPMFIQDKLVGFINLDSSTAGFFTEDHAALAQTFGNQAAVAIEKARLFQEENRRSQIIEAMANIANEFATAREITPVLDKISHRALELLHASTVAVYLLQDDNKTIKVVAAQGSYREQLMSHTLQLGTGITGNIIVTGKPEIIDDMLKDIRRVTVPGTPEKDAQRDTIMSAPLILRGKPIGAINAWRPRTSGLFNESELNFLVSIAHQTSVTIDSIRLFQETVRHAQEAHAIAEVGKDISSTLQLDLVLDRIAQYGKELLRAETSAVYLSNSDETLLHAIAAVGIDAKEIKNFPLSIGEGILGNIALQKYGEIVNNTLEDHRAITVEGTDTIPNEHLMGVPVFTKDHLTGLLAVWRTGEDELFRPHELDFLSSLAQQAAVAIENARLFEVEQRHFREAEILRQAGEALTSSLDIQQVLDSVLDNLNRVVPFDSASVYLIENDMIRLTAVKGEQTIFDVLGQIFSLDHGLFLEISQTGLPIIIKDAQLEPRYKSFVDAHTHGWMGVPLVTRGKIIGYISIDSLKVNAFREHDATLVMTFAHQAAVAIENARLYERGEQQIRQLTVLRDIDSAISSSFDLRITLNLLIGYATRELNADAVTVLLYNSDLKSLYLYTNTGLSSEHTNTTYHIRVGEGLAGQVILQRKLVHVENLVEAAELHPVPYTIGENFKCYYGVPLFSKGQVKGVMEIFMRQACKAEPDWLNFLETLAGQAAIAIDNVQLFRNLQRSNQELILAYDTTLAGWGRALELRDKETQGHTDRVVELTLELARRMGIEGEELTHVMRGTMLHDIGKMGIPDHILHKPGPLTEEEWVIMRQHPQYAYDLMNPIPYLRQAVDIPYGHHERWDGSGYPRGLKGEEIPLAARIFAVVDIWDALLYERVYRNAWPEEKVIEYLKNTAGIELDPNIVEKFLELIEENRVENQAE